MIDDDFLASTLVELGAVSESQMDDAYEEKERTGASLGHVLVDCGFITEDQMLGVIADQLGMEVVHIKNYDVPNEVLKKVSAAFARAYEILPIRFEDNTLTVALADPLNPTILDDLHFMLEMNVKGAISNREDIMEAIQKFYGTEGESVEDILKEIESDLPVERLDDEEIENDVIQLRELATEAPVIKLLNLILIQAIRDRASDIHFEPFEDEFKIRYRVDGVLYEMIPPPKHLALALTSRIKVISNLNIAERRLPQDGRIQLNVMGRNVDIRVSCLPTAFGESVVMRVLDRQVVNLDMGAARNAR